MLNIVANFQRRFLANTPGPEDDFWYTSPMGLALPSSGFHASVPSALRLDAVYACTAYLSRIFGALPAKVFRRFPDGTREERSKHRLYEVLHYQPNEINTAYEFRGWEQVYIELGGNSYAQIVPGARGAVDQLLPLDPARVRPFRKTNGQLVYDYHAPDGRAGILLPEEVHHIRNLSLDGITGLSTISVWSDVIGYGLLLQDYANRYTRNDSRPSGIIEVPGALTPETAALMLERWQKAQTGANRGRVAIVDNGDKFAPMQISNQDAQFIESRQFNVPQIARLFGLPPTKIGWLEKSSYSNVEELNIATVTDALMPRAVQREQAIRRDLLTPAEREQGFFIEYDLNALLRGNLHSRYEAYGVGIDKGFLTRNEPRRWENLNPLPGLDKPLVPLNMAVVEPDGSLGATTGDRRATERRAADAEPEERNAVLAITAARSLAGSECAAVRRALTREGSADLLCAWLEQYYSELPARLISRLGLEADRAQAYSEAHRTTAIAAARSRQLGAVVDTWEKSASRELAALALERIAA